METLLILEFIGMVGTISGSFLISKKSKKDDFIFWGFLSFMSANVVLFGFSSGIGMVSLQVQMFMFFLIGIPVIKSTKLGKIYKKRVNLYILASAIVAIALYLSLKSDTINYTFTYTEIFTAIIAVIGSYIMKYKKDAKVFGFFLFFVADIIYVGIAIEKSLLFFGLQSLFFWYTSIRGMRNNLDGESLTAYIARQRTSLKNNINKESIKSYIVGIKMTF